MKIFCSGIGGIGLSAYASLQRQRGHEVSGSDRSDSALLDVLRGEGIAISLAQDGSAVPEDADLFVFSEAIPPDAPERKRATELSIPQQSYFQALGETSKGSFVIAVCGTHGKSSTTAMAARMLIEAGRDPTVVVGTKVPELGGRNVRVGKSNLFLVEACEYRRSFHYLSPQIILLTTVDGDHFDAFADIAEYREAFVTFLKRLPMQGVIVTHGADADCRAAAQASGRRFVDADALVPPDLAVPGAHMRQNAQLVVGLARELGISEHAARTSLAGFSGTWRRMETKGEWRGALVIDDYAHHPREIRATLGAMREAYADRRLVCVFQPHTHDRTIKLYDEFLGAFSAADLVIVPGVYAARSEADTAKVDLPRFLQDIAKGSGVEVLDGKSLAETEKMLGQLVRPDDVIVCMGAGDITSLAARLTA